jgi:hypothetical protein
VRAGHGRRLRAACPFPRTGLGSFGPSQAIAAIPQDFNGYPAIDFDGDLDLDVVAAKSGLHRATSQTSRRKSPLDESLGARIPSNGR